MKKVMFALLAAAWVLVSCEKGQPVVVIPENSTVHVSVGASFAETKSTVENNGGARTLKFTAGDRLYVHALISGTQSGNNGGEKMSFRTKGEAVSEQAKYLVGFLDIEDVPAEGATSAQFKGDLQVYEDSGTGEVVLSSHTFTTTDPLSECESEGTFSRMATLVHSKTASHYFVSSNDQRGILDESLNRISSSVEDYMTEFMDIRGNYDASSQSFDLDVFSSEDNTCHPIFDCHVNSLTAGATYQVFYMMPDGERYFNNYLGEIQADGNGSAAFVCSPQVPLGKITHHLRFIRKGELEWKRVTLGEKSLTNKVYKITRTAAVEPDQPVKPTVTGVTLKDHEGEYRLDLFQPDEDINFTLSGTSKQYVINLDEYKSCTVTLDHLTAYYNGNMHAYLFGTQSAGFTVRLIGDNVISCPYAQFCIDAGRWYNGSVYLTGNGTLTVTSQDHFKVGGIEGYNNYGNWSSPEDLAAPGSTVTVSDVTQNSDGTYTRTYTVTTNN